MTEATSSYIKQNESGRKSDTGAAWKTWSTRGRLCISETVKKGFNCVLELLADKKEEKDVRQKAQLLIHSCCDVRDVQAGTKQFDTKCS